MVPASATRPDAVTAALLEATRPLLIPIATEVPLLQTMFDEAIWTFHSPSNVAAMAGAAVTSAAKSNKREMRDILRARSIVYPCSSAATVSRRYNGNSDGSHARSSGLNALGRSDGKYNTFRAKKNPGRSMAALCKSRRPRAKYNTHPLCSSQTLHQRSPY